MFFPMYTKYKKVYYFLGCNAAYWGSSRTFRMSLLLACYLRGLLFDNENGGITPKRRRTSTEVQAVTFHKAISFIVTTSRTPNPTDVGF
jgi:hypothetical protein